MFILALGNSSVDKLSKAGHSNIKNNSCADVYSVSFFFDTKRRKLENYFAKIYVWRSMYKISVHYFVSRIII
jgi:hypothetical protein